MRAARAVLLCAALLLPGCRGELEWLADAGTSLDSGLSGDGDAGSADAGTTDAGSSDAGATCEGPLTSCPSGCVDLMTDPNNCGECGYVCEGRGTSCVDGLCLPDYEWARWPAPSTDSSNYKTGTDTVEDRTTGLLWQRSPPVDQRTWQQAVDYCTGLTLNGMGGWRLPTRIELRSIVDTANGLPAINVTAFPDTPNTITWTSTRVAGLPGQAWSVHFGSGHSYGQETDSTGFARCVHLASPRRSEQ